MDDFIIENYYTLGSTRIAQHLGISRSKVLADAKRLGLDTSISTVKSRLRSKPQTESFFRYKKILDFNQPDTAYLLGLIWADGHLSGNTLTCSFSYKDNDHFRNVFSPFNFRYKLYSQVVRDKVYEMCRFQIHNKDICEKLRSLDIDRKTFVSPFKIKDILSEENFKLFILGFFDGDGCFHYTRNKDRVITFAFNSNSDVSLFKDYFEGIFSSVVIRKHPSQNSLAISIKRKKDVIKFYEMFIQPYPISLERKRSVFLRMMNEPDNYYNEHGYKRSVVVHNGDNTLFFSSITDASRHLNIPRGCLQDSLRSGNKTHNFLVSDKRLIRECCDLESDRKFMAWVDPDEESVWEITDTKPKCVSKAKLKPLLEEQHAK